MPSPTHPLLLSTLCTLAIIVTVAGSTPYAYSYFSSGSNGQSAGSRSTGGGSGMNGTQPRDSYGQSSYYGQSAYRGSGGGGSSSSYSQSSYYGQGSYSNNSRAQGGAADRNSVSGYSRGSGTGNGNSGGGSRSLGSDGNGSGQTAPAGGGATQPGGILGKVAQIASAAKSMGIDAMKAVVEGAKKLTGGTTPQLTNLPTTQPTVPPTTPANPSGSPTPTEIQSPGTRVPANIQAELDLQKRVDKRMEDLSYLPTNTADREKLRKEQERFERELNERQEGEYQEPKSRRITGAEAQEKRIRTQTYFDDIPTQEELDEAQKKIAAEKANVDAEAAKFATGDGDPKAFQRALDVQKAAQDALTKTPPSKSPELVKAEAAVANEEKKLIEGWGDPAAFVKANEALSAEKKKDADNQMATALKEQELRTKKLANLGLNIDPAPLIVDAAQKQLDEQEKKLIEGRGDPAAFVKANEALKITKKIEDAQKQLDEQEKKLIEGWGDPAAFVKANEALKAAEKTRDTAVAQQNKERERVNAEFSSYDTIMGTGKTKKADTDVLERNIKEGKVPENSPYTLAEATAEVNRRNKLSELDKMRGYSSEYLTKKAENDPYAANALKIRNSSNSVKKNGFAPMAPMYIPPTVDKPTTPKNAIPFTATADQARRGDNPTITPPKYTADNKFIGEPVLDRFKLFQLNEQKVTKAKKGDASTNGRDIEPLTEIIANADTDIIKQIAINNIPAHRRNAAEIEKINKMSPEEVQLQFFLGNQAEVANYESRQQGKKEPYADPTNLTSAEKVDAYFQVLEKKFLFNPKKISEDSPIIDATYDGDPRAYKLTKAPTLPLIGDIDKNLDLIPGSQDTPEKRRDIITRTSLMTGDSIVAAGARTGNAKVESDTSWKKGGKEFDKTASGDNGTAYGLYQYRGKRQDGMFAFAKTKNPGLVAQTLYQIAETRGTSPVSDPDSKRWGDYMKANPKTSIEDATEKFMRMVERPSPKAAAESLQKRIAGAKEAIEGVKTNASFEVAGTEADGSTSVDTKTGKPPTTPSEAVGAALAPNPKDTKVTATAKAAARAMIPKGAVAALDGMYGVFGAFLGLLGIDINAPGGPGSNPNDPSHNPLKYRGLSNEGVETIDAPSTEPQVLDASSFSPQQNVATLLTQVFELKDTVATFVPPANSDEAKAGLIRRMTTVIGGTTYVVEHRSRLNLSGKFITVRVTENTAGGSVTFSYTDNGPDGTLDSFSANGVTMVGSEIQTALRTKFEEELRVLTNLYYRGR